MDDASVNAHDDGLQFIVDAIGTTSTYSAICQQGENVSNHQRGTVAAVTDLAVELLFYTRLILQL